MLIQDKNAILLLLAKIKVIIVSSLFSDEIIERNLTSIEKRIKQL